MTHTIIPFRKFTDRISYLRTPDVRLEGFSDHMLRDIGIEPDSLRLPISDNLFFRMRG